MTTETVLSLSANAVIVLGFVIERITSGNKSAREKGELVKTIEQDRKDIDRAHEKIRTIEAAQITAGNMQVRVEERLNGIESWLKRIADKMGVA